MSTYVLVHGAWFGGWSYKRVADKLRAQGHTVYTPTLTGIGERSHLYDRDINLATHADDVINLIKWEELDDVVLVGHSYGGMVITWVADLMPEKISRLVYLDAFVPDDGKCEMDYLPEDQVGMMRAGAAENENGIPPLPPEFFHLNENDIPMVNRLCTFQPIGTFEQPVKLKGGLEKLGDKRIFIWNEGFAEGSFKQFYDVLESNSEWTTYKTPNGHAVMPDAPEELARILHDLV